MNKCDACDTCKNRVYTIKLERRHEGCKLNRDVTLTENKYEQALVDIPLACIKLKKDPAIKADKIGSVSKLISKLTIAIKRLAEGEINEFQVELRCKCFLTIQMNQVFKVLLKDEIERQIAKAKDELNRLCKE